MTRSMFIPEEVFFGGSKPPEVARRRDIPITGNGRGYAPGTDPRWCFAMVPLADLFNHGDVNCSAGYNVRSQAFEFRAQRQIQVGEEVLLHYGDFSNWELLHNYGFVLTENPLDCMYLSVSSCCQHCRAVSEEHSLWQELSDAGLLAPQGCLLYTSPSPRDS